MGSGGRSRIPDPISPILHNSDTPSLQHAMLPELPRFHIKDPFCGLSHFAGAVLSVGALAALLIQARGRPWQTISFAAYGLSLVVLYTASALYHSLPDEPPLIDRLKRCDHIGIYLLIAGTYAPVCLVTLHGPWGWSMLAVEFILATIGITATLRFGRAPNWLRVILYLSMGWLAVFALRPLGELLPSAALIWLLAGGLFYTVGTAIYALDKPHLWPGRFSAHDLWHVFVLAGSASHFVLISRFVAV